MSVGSAIAATVICYAVLGILLLSLNLTALWRWWIKALAILLTVGACIGSYFAMNGLLGWPASIGMPERFNLLATRIVEPDTARGAPGHIYLWLEQIDEQQRIVSAPRAYEVPFALELAFEVEKAQDTLDDGGSILGEFDTSEAEAATDTGSAPNDEQIDRLAGGNDGGVSTGDGARFEGTRSNPSLVFSDMPPVPLPSKPDIEGQ